MQDVGVCERYARELAAAGGAVTWKEYPGAYHAWDGGARRFRYGNTQGSKACDMEPKMTDVPGGGVGNAARDFKNGRTLVSYEEWMAAVKGCMAINRSGIGGNPSQSDALVADVLLFVNK